MRAGYYYIERENYPRTTENDRKRPKTTENDQKRQKIAVLTT